MRLYKHHALWNNRLLKSLIVIVSIAIITGCHNTRALIVQSKAGCLLDSTRIKIESPNPAIEHQIRRNLLYKLSNYAKKLQNYTIAIKIQKESDTATFSEKEVIKEQMRLIASIKIFDKNNETILKKSVDSYSSYEVNDMAPFASVSSKIDAVNSTTNDISNAIMAIIFAFLVE